MYTDFFDDTISYHGFKLYLYANSFLIYIS